MKAIKSAENKYPTLLQSLGGWGVQSINGIASKIKIQSYYYNHIEWIRMYEKCKMNLFCLNKEIRLF